MAGIDEFYQHSSASLSLRKFSRVHGVVGANTKHAATIHLLHQPIALAMLLQVGYHTISHSGMLQRLEHTNFRVHHGSYVVNLAGAKEHAFSGRITAAGIKVVESQKRVGEDGQSTIQLGAIPEKFISHPHPCHLFFPRLVLVGGSRCQHIEHGIRAFIRTNTLALNPICIGIP